jgi:DHA1 family multidrug resistance protein-like MFS transporter
MSDLVSARAPSAPALWSPGFLKIVLAQGMFGFGWCLYLLQAKFFTGALGVGPREVGLVGATSGVASVGSIALLLTVIDRRGGRRAAFLTGAALLFFSSSAYLLVHRFGVLVYVLQAGVAMSYVLAFNSAMALVTEVAPPERLGQAFGLQSAANLSMNAISSLVAEAVSERWGWHAVYGVAAGAALVSFFLGLALPPGGYRAEARSTDSPPYGVLLPVFVTSALMGAAFSAMFVFHQPYALSFGAKRVGAFFVGFTTAALVMRLGFGSLGDRLGYRRAVLTSLVLYAAVPLTMAWLVPSVLWAYGAGLGLAHGVAYPTLTALATERAPHSTRGRVIAVFSGSFSIGTSGGALAWGYTAEHAGYPTLFVLASAVVVAAFVTLAFSSRLHRPLDRA